MQDAAVKPHEIMAVSLMALVMALGLVLTKPMAGLYVAAGFLIMLVALASVRAALYLLIFSMLLSPEIGVGQVQGHGVGGRAISFRLDDILLIVIGMSWLAKTIFYRELTLIKQNPLNRPILYYMLVCILATLLGILAGRVAPMTAFFYLLKYFEYFFLFFMVVNNITTKDQMVRMVVALLATCCLISLYGISHIPSGMRATAPFEGGSGEPNTLGGYLVFMAAIMIGLLLHLPLVKGKTAIPVAKVRTALFVLLGISMLALMATLSRTSYLAGAVLLLAVGVMQRSRPLIVGLVLLGIAILPLVAPDNVKNRIGDTFFGRQYGGEVTVLGITLDLSTSERLKSWQLVIRDWKKQPLLGYGVTGYAWTDAQFVKILGETGLAGLTAFMFLIYRLWVKSRDVYLKEQDPFCKGLAQGFLLGIVAVLAHGIGANTFIIIRIMEPFWLCAGLVMAMPTLQGKVNAEGSEQAAA